MLLLAMPAAEDLRALAARLTHGLIVVLVPGEQIYECRRIARDFENVMVTPGDPAMEIPWRDGFFTVVWSPALTAATGEIRRVVAPEGSVILAS